MKAMKVFITGSIILASAVLLKAYGAEFVYDAKGKRDPFTPLVGERKETVAIEDILSIEDIILEGIAVGPKGSKMAIMNGTMLKEGDKAGNLEIRKISAQSVTVLKDGREYELTLKVLEDKR